MCLSLLQLSQLFFESRTFGASQTGAKTELNAKYPFKVIQYHILGSLKSWRPTAYCYYNNAGIISKVFEEIARKTLKFAVVDNPTCCLTPLPRETRINLTSPETIESLAYIFPLIVCVYLHSGFCGGLRKTHLFCNRMHTSRLRSSKVVDFGTNRNGVRDFLIVINSNFGPILHRFWDTVSYWLKIANLSYPLSFNALARGDRFRISG